MGDSAFSGRTNRNKRARRKPVAGADYAEGRKFTWHGFCSTTKSIKVLENPLFCGKTGRVAPFASPPADSPLQSAAESPLPPLLQTLSGLSAPLTLGGGAAGLRRSRAGRPRTFFIIALTQGQARDITRYSLLSDEDEVLLPPGCMFRVPHRAERHTGRRGLACALDVSKYEHCAYFESKHAACVLKKQKSKHAGRRVL